MRSVAQETLAGPTPREAADRIRAHARGLGFAAVGVARADVSLEQDLARYDAFVAAGMFGDMGWLAQNREVRARLDGEGVLPGARSVICLARNYRSPRPEEGAGIAPAIARYARGQDYHKFLRRRVRRLASFVRSLGSPDHPVHARPLCDDAPILERAWAARAGLGFVGKNGLLIVPGVGSMVLLGEVVTTLAIEADDPMAERCGACTRCLDACPTGAFAAPFVLDARRCVSYLTIEHRGPIAPELRSEMGGHVFGCDDCQTACPFNASGRSRPGAPEEASDPFAPLARWSRIALEELLALSDDQWAVLSLGTPLKRAGKEGLARNAAIVLGNRGDAAALPSLRRTAGSHPDVTVREAAAWALERIESLSRGGETRSGGGKEGSGDRSPIVTR